MSGPYDDDLSEDDQKVLDSQAESDKQIVEAVGGRVPGVIEADSDEANAETIAEANAESAEKTAAAAPAGDAPPAAPAPPEDPPGETLEAFIARHKDKTPAELAELIGNREKRAAREGFQRRRQGRAPEAIQADRDALKARRDALATGKAELDKKIEEDPDAATRAVAEHALQLDLDRIAAAEAQLSNEEHIARLDNAIEFGAKYIPDFAQTYPEMRQFAAEIGYSEGEIDSVADGRDLVVLNLARMAGNLIQSRVIDVRGNLLPQVKPVADAVTDPRLKAPAAPATHSGPAVAATPPKSIEEAINGALSMSDADFNKLSEAEINRLMGA